jgi:hypothetical protein
MIFSSNLWNDMLLIVVWFIDVQTFKLCEIYCEKSLSLSGIALRLAAWLLLVHR